MTKIDYPKLNRFITVVQSKNNQLHIRTGPWEGPIITIRDPNGVVEALIELLDGSHHRTEILEKVGEENKEDIISLMEQFRNKGIIYDGRKESAEVWPHVVANPNTSIDSNNSSDIQNNSITIISSDFPERVLCGRVRDIGVESIKYIKLENGRRVEPDSQIPSLTHPPSELSLDEILSDSNYVLCAVRGPNADLLKDVNRILYEKKTPWTPIQAIGYDGIVGPTVFPDETACYSCFVDRMLPNIPDPTQYQAFQRQDVPSQVETPPGLCALVVGYAVLDIPYILQSGSGFTVGNILSVNGSDLAFESNRLMKFPRCDICGSLDGSSYNQIVGLEEMIQSESFKQQYKEEN